MRSSIVALCKRSLAAFFAFTLAFGLVPIAAFAEEPAGTETAEAEPTAAVDDAMDADLPVEDELASADGEGSSEGDEQLDGDSASKSAVPKSGILNETMPLETVAQAEATKSFFLAQTLESIKTVPVVSAKLPLDTGADGTSADASADAVADGDASDEGAEGGEDPDEPDLAGVAVDSTVVGSFIYRGITYAVEPGGESVAVVAADYAKLPEEFVEAQTIVLPSVVTSDGADLYSVSRIADEAFSSLTESAAVATQGGRDADVPSSIQAKAEAFAYTGQANSDASEEGATSEQGAEGSDASDAEGEKAASEEEPSIGIFAITIPASIVEIGDDAFSGFDTLRYVIVSEDNPAYGMYDGCLYDASLTSLLLIPEGRPGAVRIAFSAISIDPQVFSHCTVDTIIVDVDSAAFTSENGFLHNVDLVTFEFPVPIVLMRDGAVVDSTCGLDEAHVLSLADHDEAFISTLIANEQMLIDGSLKDAGFEGTVSAGQVSSDTKEGNIADRHSATSNGASPDLVSSEAIVEDGAETMSSFGEAEKMSPRAYTTPDGVRAYSMTSKLVSAASSGETGGTLATGTWSEGVGSSLILDSQPYANWRLIGMTLYIFCEPGHVISDAGNPFSGWTYNSSDDDGAWASVRSIVSTVVMQEGLETETMQGWFKNMYSLADVSRVFVPEGCKSAQSTFQDCISIASFPDGFSLPYGIERTPCMFWGCDSVTTFPVGFWIPSTVVDANTMFYECDSLVRMPAGFSLSKNEDGTGNELGAAANFSQLFLACRSLRSLPYGFEIPENAKDIGRMFRDCDALDSLPSTLVLFGNPVIYGGSDFADDAGETFAVHAVYDPKVTTYYAGDLANLMPTNAVLSSAEKAMVGEGKAYATEVQCFWGERYGRDLQKAVREDAEAEVRLTASIDGEWKTISTVRANAAGIVTDPGIPKGYDGYDFGGWYCEASLQHIYDFDLPLTGQVLTNGETKVVVDSEIIGEGDAVHTVYFLRAKLIPKGVSQTGDLFSGRWTSGEGSDLADIEEGHARWIYDEGTLTIECDPGWVISEEGNPFAGWTWSTGDAGAWAAQRTMVERVVLPESFATETMQGWFKGMTELERIDNLRVPKGCKTVANLFYDCYSLSSLPTGFQLPYGLLSTACMFWNCKSLVTLPQGFWIPSTVTDANTMFYECDALEYLNSDFSLHKNEAGTGNEDGSRCNYMQTFLACRSLKSLPYGLEIPKNATSVARMLRDCDALSSLPSTFVMSDVASTSTGEGFADDAGETFTVHAVYEPKLVTYYAGDLSELMPASAVLSAAEKAMVGAGKAYATEVQCFWGERYGRDLRVADREDAEAEVRFTVPEGDGWATYSVMKTDAQGIVLDPGTPQGFDDYAFGGWFCDSRFQNRFSFTQPVGGQTLSNGVDIVPVDTETVIEEGRERTIYLIRAQMVGPIVNCTIPICTDLSIDLSALGNAKDHVVTESGEFSFYSTREYQEGSVAVTGVFATAGPGGFEMFPDDDDRSSIRLLLDLGHGKGDGFVAEADQSIEMSMAYENREGLAARFVDAGTNEFPATLDGRVRLKIPVNIKAPATNREYEEVVRLLWTIQVI